MLNFGLQPHITDESIPTVELARWAEDQGFESLFMGEHSHIPTSRKTPFFSGELPEYFPHLPDPFIELTAAATVTQKLKVGTGVCLVTEHHPISLAKTVATLDRLSQGRFIFGIGAGWNVEEMAHHQVDFKDRWQVTRERVLAMKEIWAHDEAEFHGRFVNFDPIWCWPKPVQAGGPPMLLGVGANKWAPKRIVEYCNGWFPVDGFDDIAGGVEALRTEASRSGRSLEEFDLSVLAAYAVFGATGAESRIRELSALGFTRIVLLLEPAPRDTQWPVLEQYARLVKTFR